MTSTTIGQLLVNDALPESYQDHSRTIDKASLRELLTKLADEHPEQYKDVVQKLYRAGAEASTAHGASFGLRHLRPTTLTAAKFDSLRRGVQSIREDGKLDDDGKDAKVVSTILAATKALDDDNFSEGMKSDNPLAWQVASGSRGSKSDLRSLQLGDLLVTDHKNRVIPVPILRSYSSGLDPAEFWASSYGARKGVLSTKLTTADAGFFGKKLVSVAHRMVVSENDCGTDRGITVPADDLDNAGTVLGKDVDDIPAGTVLTPTLLKKIGDKPILVRSAMTCGAKHGVCSRCAGVREDGFPKIGDNIGVAAAQSIGERVSQTALSEKHSGGKASGKEMQQRPTGFNALTQMTEVPNSFKFASVLASTGGHVQSIDPAPQGGNYVTIDKKSHYIEPGLALRVKIGDQVDAGDMLSDGIPNPADMVKYKGIGAARRSFVDEFRKTAKDSGINVNRRNLELIARGLVNHVRVTDLDGPEGSLPDDIVEYDSMERNYKPRFGALRYPPKRAVGMYLEAPALHYTIGTPVTKRVAADLDQNGIPDVLAHADEPSFQPEMVRDMENLVHAPDWQVRLGGSYMERGLLDATRRGIGSEDDSPSFIPALARGKDFGAKLKTEGLY
jgi:DNA-directed RNA polymerase subunit beta'